MITHPQTHPSWRYIAAILVLREILAATLYELSVTTDLIIFLVCSLSETFHLKLDSPMSEQGT